MKSFRNGQRVFVQKTAHDHHVQAKGTVVRLRIADDGAWVSLDERSTIEAAHPFPASDPGGRGTYVLAYPEDCEATS